MKVYQKINKEQNNKRAKERKENDPLYKLSCNIRSLITKSINRKGYKKESKTFNILNCSFDFLNDKNTLSELINRCGNVNTLNKKKNKKKQY